MNRYLLNLYLKVKTPLYVKCLGKLSLNIFFILTNCFKGIC